MISSVFFALCAWNSFISLSALGMSYSPRWYFLKNLLKAALNFFFMSSLISGANSFLGALNLKKSKSVSFSSNFCLMKSS